MVAYNLNPHFYRIFRFFLHSFWQASFDPFNQNSPAPGHICPYRHIHKIILSLLIEFIAWFLVLLLACTSGLWNLCLSLIFELIWLPILCLLIVVLGWLELSECWLVVYLSLLYCSSLFSWVIELVRVDFRQLELVYLLFLACEPFCISL